MRAETPTLRLGIVGVVIVALLGTLFTRLWFLQVLDAPEYEVAAEIIQVREVPIPASRGRILDRNGKVIVDNRISLVVSLDSSFLRDEEEVTRVLTVVAEEMSRSGQRTKVAELQRRLGDKRFESAESKPLAEDVDEEVAVVLVERSEELPGLSIERRAVRTYPYGSVAAHVLGYVGRISPTELDAKRAEPIDESKPYRLNDDIGKSGLERIFENDMRGTPGLRRVEVDTDEVPIRVLEEVLPEPGSDVQLTIDIDLQAAAEKALAEQVRSLRSPGGAVTVLDPSNGSVLAMASYPTYDPTEFVNGISNERFAEIQASGEEPLLNRALQSSYPPGSTFKLVTAYAAMDTGLINANSSYLDAGVYTLSGCKGSACQFKNAKGARYGTVGVQRALTVSSNVFFAWLGERFWLNRTQYGYAIADTARKLGMGAATGIQLPLESRGFMPDPDTKMQRSEDYPEVFPDGNWYTGDNVNSALGQGDVIVTPLQLVNAYATFANGGVLHAPNIVWRVLKIRNETGVEIVRTIEPRVVNTFDVPPHVRTPIEAGLRDAVANPSGTSYRPFEGFDLAAFPIAAKTGTAEVRGKEDNAVFAAYAPIGAPRYAISIVIEAGGFGSVGAAPVARYLFDRIAGQVPLEPAPTDRPVVKVNIPPEQRPPEEQPATTTSPTTTSGDATSTSGAATSGTSAVDP